CRCGVGRHQGDALGDFAAHWFSRTYHGHRLGVAFDDDLASGLDPFEDRPYLLDQIAFADVKRLHTWDHSASPSSSGIARRRLAAIFTAIRIACFMLRASPWFFP